MLKISILIPARNEEKVLPRLLHSIENLDYPFNDYEILFANDQSEDKTGQILNEFALTRPNVSVLEIENNNQFINLKGKARALAFLAEKAKGEILLFTDADVELPKNWLTGMWAAFKIGEQEKNQKIGVVVGVTGIKPTTWLAAMQGLEWLQVLTVIKSLDKKNISTTGMGNNMAVTSEAYNAVGGYEKIGFSIVEDYALYMTIVKHGFGHFQAFSPDVLAWTLPPPRFFEQRKRWLKGAIESKSPLIFGGFLRAFSLPIYSILGFYYWPAALCIFIIDLLFSITNTFIFEKKLNLNGFKFWLPLYSFYGPIAWFLQLANYFFNKNVNWKGRRF